MTTVENRGGINPWRVIGWGAVAVLLSIPAVARFPWRPSDFVFAGVLLGGVGLLVELAVRASRNGAYRAAALGSVAAAFLLIWINAAVGIIGSEGNPANLMYLGVIAVGALGAAVARGRAAGMARALAAAALVQGAITVAVFALRLGADEPPGQVGVLVLNGFFLVLLAGCAWLFAIAARPSASG